MRISRQMSTACCTIYCTRLLLSNHMQDNINTQIMSTTPSADTPPMAKPGNQSYLVHCNHVWGNAELCYLTTLSALWRKATCIVGGANPWTSTHDLTNLLWWITINGICTWLLFIIANIIGVIEICGQANHQTSGYSPIKHFYIAFYFIRTLKKQVFVQGSCYLEYCAEKREWFWMNLKCIWLNRSKHT